MQRRWNTRSKALIGKGRKAMHRCRIGNALYNFRSPAGKGTSNHYP